MRLRAKWLVLSFCVSGTVNRQEYWLLCTLTWPRSLSSTYLCRTSWLCAWKTAWFFPRARSCEGNNEDSHIDRSLTISKSESMFKLRLLFSELSWV
jgi:hypothetical protein